MNRLISKAEWVTFNPWAQGYTLYMQAELPNSELKGLKNPWKEDTEQYHQFVSGQVSATIEVQDQP